MKLLLTVFLFLILYPFEGYCQEVDYASSVKTCLSNEAFKDFKYRNRHEKECFVGLKAPTFTAEDINGNIIDIDSMVGKIVVLNFWFTKCPPCLAEIPGLNNIKEKYENKDILFLAPCNESTEEVKAFFEKTDKHYDFTIIPDGFSLFRDTFLTKSGFPTTIVIDKQGIIRDYFSGGPASRIAVEVIQSKLEPMLEALLKE